MGLNDSRLMSGLQDFLNESRRLNGSVVREREPWITEVTADAIRHYAYGISDDNPLWLDADYARDSRFGRLVAPPTFLCAVLYPVLHGAAVAVRLSSLIVELGFVWYEPVRVGDRLRAIARQVDAVESRDGSGRATGLILSDVRYWNQHDAPVAKAEATLARLPQEEGTLRLERDVHRYTDEELRVVGESQRRERRSGRHSPAGREIAVGDTLPPLVRGPLTIGDLVGWQAAIGPSYRPGALGYRDTLDNPHTTVINPVTGWPVKYSQQHEDFLLASQRGMPTPFDNGVMRLAWLSPLVTNWIGDDGWLESLTIQLQAPNLYGDTTWYRGTVTGVSSDEDDCRVTIELTGTNQRGETTTTGSASVRVPSVRQRSSRRKASVHPASTNKDAAEARREPSVLAQFCRQVDRAPNDIALVSGNVFLTYRELDARATRLATRLASHGLVGGDYVGICLPRSADWIVAMLAVLRAGGAFVPLDPAYPRQRLEAMVSQVRPALVLVSRQAERLLPSSGTRTLLFERATEDINETAERAPTPLIADGQDPPAYAVFTSGTTGTPNGVAMSHVAFGEYVDVMRRTLEVGPNDVYLHTAPFAFSASMRQVFVPLCGGATLLVADESERHDPLALLQLIKARHVTVWDTVPSVFRQVVDFLPVAPGDRDRATSHKSLRLIALTGEPLGWDLPTLWRERAGRGAKILNLYSHSETCGTASTFPIPETLEQRHGLVPLGWPVAGSTLYVLDDARQPVARGELGEVWAGGDRLARGYLNNPHLTAERFANDPFREDHLGRMFRTGDLARRRSDGALEFVGRIDHRVNIHGHRIEPAEVESRLRQHPGVDEVVVIGRTDPTGATRLVAYVVATAAASPTADGQPRYRLPNNLAIAHVNKHETDFTYRAVFEDQTYLKHGVSLRDGACIVDVGANTGQFSLFATLVCDRPRIYAFEPNPTARAALAANMRVYDVECKVFPHGLSSENRHAPFTAFDGFSLLSGLRADIAAEKALVRTFAARAQHHGRLRSNGSSRELEAILDDRFEAHTLDIELRTLSEIIDAEGLECIDLLKINAEKSEWEILKGIRQEHWPRMAQVVVKVDLVDRLEAIVSLLESNGLPCVVDQDEVMAGTRVQTVYAVRPLVGRASTRDTSRATHPPPLPALPDPFLYPSALREFLERSVPDYMVPSLFEFCECLPVNANGKLDRAALPEPDWSHPLVGGEYQPPASSVERRLVEIWADVLKVDRIGVHDSFLDLGGDSITAMRIINSVRREFTVELSHRNLFSAPTVSAMAKTIGTHRDEDH